MLNGQPFRMVIEPDGNHAIVHFEQWDADLISKSVRIDSVTDERREIILDSTTAVIPGGHIEFADMTILPERFRIRVGQTLFDVMQRGIEVDGDASEWLQANALD